MIGYVAAKARQYMRLGADRYLRADRFSLPSSDLSDADLLALTTGMGQLATDSGGTVNDPIIGLTVEQVHLLLDILHFRMASHCTSTGRRGFVDQYGAEHVVTGKAMSLFATPFNDVNSLAEVRIDALRNEWSMA